MDAEVTDVLRHVRAELPRLRRSTHAEIRRAHETVRRVLRGSIGAVVSVSSAPVSGVFFVLEAVVCLVLERRRLPHVFAAHRSKDSAAAEDSARRCACLQGLVRLVKSLL